EGRVAPHGPTVRADVAETRAGAEAPDAGRRVARVAQPRGIRGLAGRPARCAALHGERVALSLDAPRSEERLDGTMESPPALERVAIRTRGSLVTRAGWRLSVNAE